MNAMLQRVADAVLSTRPVSEQRPLRPSIWTGLSIEAAGVVRGVRYAVLTAISRNRSRRSSSTKAV